MRDQLGLNMGQKEEKGVTVIVSYQKPAQVDFKVLEYS